MKVKFWIVALLSVLSSVLYYLYVLHNISDIVANDCVETRSYSLDRLEDHIVTVNFALGKGYPVIGFAAPEVQYRICQMENMQTYFDMLRENGPVTFLARPPLYHLMIGAVYKVTGVRIVYEYYTVLVFYALMLGFMPLAGFKLMQMKGAVIGLITGLLCLSYFPFADYLPSLIFTAFTAFLLFVASLWLNDKKWWSYMLFGIASAITILTKGLFIFIPVLFIVWLLTKFLTKRDSGYLKNAAGLIMGLAILFIPWTTFINIKKNESQKERIQWKQQLLKSMPSYVVREPKDLDIKSNLSPIALEFLIKHLYVMYMNANGFILVTNQLEDDAILIVNNEYCTDGDWHLEWKMIPQSYHNTHHTNSSAMLRVIFFYLENPVTGVEILWNKLKNASTELPMVLWLSGALWGLYCIQRICHLKQRHSKLTGVVFTIAAIAISIMSFSPLSPLTAFILIGLMLAGILVLIYSRDDKSGIFLPALVANQLLITLAIMGVGRYITLLSPVAIFFCLYFLLKIITESWQALIKDNV